MWEETPFMHVYRNGKYGRSLHAKGWEKPHEKTVWNISQPLGRWCLICETKRMNYKLLRLFQLSNQKII